jgi:hypothetical protein
MQRNDQPADHNDNAMNDLATRSRSTATMMAVVLAFGWTLASCSSPAPIDTSGDVGAAQSAVLRDTDLPEWVELSEKSDIDFVSSQPPLPELANCPAWKAVTNGATSAEVRGSDWFKPEPSRSLRSDVFVFNTEALAVNAMAVAGTTDVGRCLKTGVEDFANKQAGKDVEPTVTGRLDPVRIVALGSNPNVPWHFSTVYKPIAETATTQSAALDYVFERKGRSIVFFQISEVQMSDLDILPVASERVGAMTKVFNRLPEPAAK